MFDILDDEILLPSIDDIALDVANGHMYWTSGFKIQRANLDGSSVFDILDDEILLPSVDAIALLLEPAAAPVPEPATVALLGIGLAGLAGGAVRRRLKKAKQ